jgi:endonuclease YncB( thermonuclease family)
LSGIKKIVLAVLAFALIGCKGVSSLKVSSVLDGDTIVLNNGRHVRLLGIDTPEVHTRKFKEFVFDPKPYGLDAKRFLENMVLGKEVFLEYDVQPKDDFGRALAYCFVKGNLGKILFVNAALARQGLGIVYLRFPNYKYKGILLAAQQNARAENKNLWSLPFISEAEALNHIDEIRQVKCFVRDVYEGKKVFILKCTTAFKVVIFKDSLQLFSQGNIDLTGYRGRHIVVVGRIRLYKGVPEIIVGYPEQIFAGE